MGYIKSIEYGNNLELYIYEKECRIRGGGTNLASRNNLQNMVNDRVSIKSRQIQKRRDNTVRTSNDFRRLVLSNYERFSFALYITCTYSIQQEDVGIGYEDHKTFIQNLRSRFGKEFRYVSVPEFQKNGRLHFHSIFWGLPEALYKEERRTRLVASLWGWGFVDVDLIKENQEIITSYLAKYMSKSNNDERLFGKKAYRCSRNIKRPIIDKNTILLYVEEKYGLVDKLPLLQKDFMTQWLGKGRYLLYKNLYYV